MIGFSNLYFPISALLISILISILYFNRDRISNKETKIYDGMVLINLIESVTAFFIVSFALSKMPLIVLVVLNKIDYLLIFSWICLLFCYVYTLNFDNKSIIKFSFIINIIVSIAILITNITIVNENGIMNSYGLSNTLLFGAVALYLVIIIGIVIHSFVISKTNKKKYIPVIILILLIISMMIIRLISPEINMLAFIMSFINLIMFFTIENPDVKMIEKLNLAKDQADKANRAKTDFLSSMSHEIRTPLNAIVGFSDCVTNANTLDEAKENAKDIVNASQTLLEIVNSILDISKIEAGKLEIVNSPYNAKKVFEELAKLITPKMNEKGLAFTYNIAPDLPETLYGDHANIKKIITNLLSNACKYTSSGFVNYDVSCFNVNGICKLIISVEDSGRGIKKEDVDKLFTKFQRMDEDRNTTIEGTGLGLAITKQLVELMGGKIIVHTVYGEGSKFTVTIDQRIEEVKIYEAEKIQNTTLNLFDKKILLVDDNELNIKVATKLLQRYQANNITTFSNGYDCIENIKSGNSYDIILLDDMMPKLSGVETLKELKNIPNFNIPVVALTANALTGMKEKYLNEGFNNYLAKPIDKDDLIRVLNETIETSKDNLVEKLEIFEYEEPIGKAYLIENNVDISKALELLGDMDMYNSTISDFISELEEKWNRIVKYKEELDMENYAIEVHSLKSDCKYLGFTSLAEISYQHELKSKESDKDYVVNNFINLENEYKKVKNIATSYIEQIEII